MLWIPTTLTEREFWAQKIYGTSNLQPLLQASRRERGYWPRQTNPWWSYARSRPLLAPEPDPFWKNYGFSTEEELDAFLGQYAVKLKNFDYANALNVIKAYIDKAKILSHWGYEIKISYEQRQARKQEYEWEYQYYLGPIKFALKYDIPQIFIYGGSDLAAPNRVTIVASGATTRQSLIITLYDGTRLQAISKTQQPIIVHGIKLNWYIPFTEILEIIKLPNVVSVEASDTPVPYAATMDASKLWKDIKTQIYQNYVKYLQSPPTAQPITTQPSGAQPSGAVVTSKTWTWIAIGGGAILLLLLLTRRK